MVTRDTAVVPGSPLLTHVRLLADRAEPGVYPFTLPILSRGLTLSLSAPVTFFVGENGSGKSTLLEALSSYGGQSFHTKSHGEAFLALFGPGFEDGLYILDEPEAALSPQRQLAFLRILHQLTAPRIAQFIIATHSPVPLAFPGATVLSLDDGEIREVDYRDTDHYRLTRDFLEAPERHFRYLFDESEE